ncbi:hypothetical protein ABZP36_023065 [Zizania latifolia]
MAVPRGGANADGETLRDPGANGERASSCRHTSSSASDEAAAYERASSRQHHGNNEPPPAQQMDRRSSEDEGDTGRIPAAVFERDPSESNKDWSMMSTDSVFALQVAPSSDFTGFFLAHPELMDISTPPRASAVVAADEPVFSPHFESIPELGDTTMIAHYSFAFPNLTEDKRYSSKKAQEVHPMAAPATATMTETAAPAPAPVEAEMSSKQQETPGKVAAKGGWLSCLPCCS